MLDELSESIVQIRSVEERPSISIFLLDVPQELHGVDFEGVGLDATHLLLVSATTAELTIERSQCSLHDLPTCCLPCRGRRQCCRACDRVVGTHLSIVYCARCGKVELPSIEH